jgi:hypothetical protein
MTPHSNTAELRVAIARLLAVDDHIQSLQLQVDKAGGTISFAVIHALKEAREDRESAILGVRLAEAVLRNAEVMERAEQDETERQNIADEHVDAQVDELREDESLGVPWVRP